MAKAEPNPTTRGAARSGNREAVVGNVRLRQVLREAAAARAAHARASAGSPQSALRPGSVSVGGEQRQRNCRQRKNAVFQIAFRQILREKQSPS